MNARPPAASAAATLAMMTTSPLCSLIQAATIFTPAAIFVTRGVTIGSNAEPISTAASLTFAFSDFIWLAKLPAERMASPCAAVVPRIMMAIRAITFCCSVALFLSIP